MGSRMGATLSLIPELEQVIQHGSRQKRVETLQRITTLFLDGASRYNDEHVDLFDDVFGLLIEEIETKARAELSSSSWRRSATRRSKCCARSPTTTISPSPARCSSWRRACRRPTWSTSPKTKSQAHLQAISARRALGEAVTDVLVRRGDREVARRVADNRGARISEMGFTRLVKRAADDGILAEKVGLRPDIPAPMFRELLTRATAIVHKRLIASATPEVKAEICDVLAKVAKEVGARVGPRDYRAAQRVVLNLHRAGRMNEAALAAFCSDGKYEEAVVALAALAKVPINVVDRLMGGDRPDPVLILCKAAGLGWPTVKAVILVPSGRKRHVQPGA